MDRGFSSVQNMHFFSGKADFVIRSKKRNIKFKGQRYYLMTWADKVELDYYMRVQSLDKSGKVKNKDVAFAVREATVDNMKLNCVVMRLENHGLCVLIIFMLLSLHRLCFLRIL